MAKAFDIVKKGYNPQQVDEYVRELEEVIKSYKEKDIAIKNALVNAQIAADNIVKNAEIEADTYRVKAYEKLAHIKNSVNQQKNYVDNFKNDYNRLVSKYLKDFNDFDVVSIENKIDELHDFINDVIADRNIDDFEDTKVVKSIKSEYNYQYEKSHLLSNEELNVTKTEDSIILRANPVNESSSKTNAFKDMFNDEHSGLTSDPREDLERGEPIELYGNNPEPPQITIPKDDKQDINNSFGAYNHKPNISNL